MAKQLTLEQFEGLEEISVSMDDGKEVPVGSREHLLNLQLIMATTSVNHEYARTEYDEVKSIERKEELMIYMSECWDKYAQAREMLSTLNPIALEEFENDLVFQKKATLTHYHA